MTNLERTAAEFLSHRRIAVAGVARGGDTAANIVYRRLRRDGYDVFAVNPNAAEVEGDLCYASVAELPPAFSASIASSSRTSSRSSTCKT